MQKKRRNEDWEKEYVPSMFPRREKFVSNLNSSEESSGGSSTTFLYDEGFLTSLTIFLEVSSEYSRTWNIQVKSSLWSFSLSLLWEYKSTSPFTVMLLLPNKQRDDEIEIYAVFYYKDCIKDQKARNYRVRLPF